MPAHGIDEEEVLRFAASVERASEHPLAAAIVARRSRAKTSRCRTVQDFDSPTGKGVTGTVEGRSVALGNAKYPRRARTSTTAPLETEAERLRRDGATAIFVAIDGKLAGVIAIADPIKATTPEALKALMRRRHPHRHADRRQPHDGRGRGAQARDHGSRGRGAAGSEERSC